MERTEPGWSGDRDAFVYALRADPTVQVRADDEGHFRLALPGVDARAPEERYVPSDSIMGELDARGSASRRLATARPRGRSDRRVPRTSAGVGRA